MSIATSPVVEAIPRIGWGNAMAKEKGWGISTDLSVLFQGKPKTSRTNNDCRLLASKCTQLANDLAAENRELRGDTDSAKVYPVIRGGVS